jgi:hypothetical protein
MMAKDAKVDLLKKYDQNSKCIQYQEIGKELKLGELSSVKVIQTLWSSYGELVRYFKNVY